MTVANFLGTFTKVTQTDIDALPSDDIWKDPRIPNWKNENGEFLFPTVRDATPNDNLVIILDDDDRVYCWGNGTLMPPPDFGGRMYALPELDKSSGPAFLGRIFNPDTGILSDPPPPPVLTKVAKADLWRRLTEPEAETLDAALQAAPLRLRRIFEAAQYLDTADEDYPALRAGIVAALGETRADEVLAPTY